MLANQTRDGTALTAAFSISGGPADYARAIKAALDQVTSGDSSLPSLIVQTTTSPASGTAANSSGAVLSIESTNILAPVVSATANITLPPLASDLKTGNPSLALFVDGTGYKLYTGTFDSGSQLTASLSAITVNGALAGNTAALTQTSATDPSTSGARAQKLFEALTSTPQTFSSSSGIGGSQPLTAQPWWASRKTLFHHRVQPPLTPLPERYPTDLPLHCAEAVCFGSRCQHRPRDVELIALQTAYGANARILTAARDMLNQLLQI